MQLTVERLGNGPIITPHMDARMGDNINGPSLIRVPEWLPDPLGRYYLYFANHDGRYIRLAYADDLTGPWKTYEPGVLPMKDSLFKGHIASPDVRVDHERQQIRLYFHGADFPSGPGNDGPQLTRLALSGNGLDFEVREEILSPAYLRVIPHGEGYLGMAMPGVFFRSKDGLSNFERGPTLFDTTMRHSALLERDGKLLVFYSRAGDQPERILLSEIDTRSDWESWRATEPVVVLEPELEYEGSDLPDEPSKRGLVMGPVRQLRDPGIFVEDEAIYLIYSVAGEYGLALARVELG